MKFLITGGLGFIGSKIIEKLTTDGHSVICLDNKETYGIISKDALDKLIGWRTRNWDRNKVQFVQGDILDRMACLKAFKTHPDVVIHLATFPRAKIVDEDPVVGVPKVIDTTTNLLWHSTKFRVKKFVYISSSMIYGDFVDGTKEDSNTKPKNIYGEAKLTGERLTKLFGKRDNLDYVIVRPTNNYGTGQYVEKFIPKAIKYLTLGKRIILHDKGLPRRTWLHVSDTVSAVIKIIESKQQNEIYNINGNYEEQNIVVAKKILYSYGILNDEDDWIDDTEKRLGQDVRYSVNDNKLKEIGWHPEADFDKELKIIVDYYKKNFIW